MKAFIEEYGMFIVIFIISLVLVGLVYGTTINSDKLKSHTADPNSVSVTAGTNKDENIIPRNDPTLLISTGITVAFGSKFDPMSYVIKAEDSDGNDIRANVQVSGSVDTSKKGQYDLIYAVTDSYGMSKKVSATFLVD